MQLTTPIASCVTAGVSNGLKYGPKDGRREVVEAVASESDEAIAALAPANVDASEGDLALQEHSVRSLHHEHFSFELCPLGQLTRLPDKGGAITPLNADPGGSTGFKFPQFS
jgi:hypothetical protein